MILKILPFLISGSLISGGVAAVIITNKKNTENLESTIDQSQDSQ